MHAPDASAANPSRPDPGTGLVETDLPAACIDIAGLVLAVNDGLCRLVGRGGLDLVGRHLGSLTAYPTDVRRSQRALAAAAAGTPWGGFTQHWEVAGLPPQRFRLAWTLNRDTQGQPTSLNLFCLDDAREGGGEIGLDDSRARVEAGRARCARVRCVHATPLPAGQRRSASGW